MQGFESGFTPTRGIELTSGTTDFSSQVPPQPDLERFPMVVWLRGDEPEVEEFSIDADRAMHLLAIKRTRLTQISGRELRVARRRVDKYVRPFFRPVDIQAYLAWTRAPATQAHASQALQQIIAKVSDDFQELSDTLITHILQNKEDSQPSSETEQKSELSLLPWVHSLQRRLERIELSLAKSQQMWSKQNNLAQSRLEETTEVLERNASKFASEASSLATQALAARDLQSQQGTEIIESLKREMLSLGDSTSALIVPILEQIAILERQLGHFGQQIEQTFSFMLAHFQEVSLQQQVLQEKLTRLQENRAEDTVVPAQYRSKRKFHRSKRSRNRSRLG